MLTLLYHQTITASSIIDRRFLVVSVVDAFSKLKRRSLEPESVGATTNIEMSPPATTFQYTWRRQQSALQSDPRETQTSPWALHLPPAKCYITRGILLLLSQSFFFFVCVARSGLPHVSRIRRPYYRSVPALCGGGTCGGTQDVLVLSPGACDQHRATLAGAAKAGTIEETGCTRREDTHTAADSSSRGIKTTGARARE